MISHANLPRRARLWTFGSGTHADSDGWVAAAGTTASTAPGRLTLRAGADGQGTLESPGELAFKAVDYRAIIVKVAAPEALTSIGVEGQTADGKWIALLPDTEVAKLARVSSGLLLPLEGMRGEGNAEFQRVRLNWKTDGNKPLILNRVAFYVR